MQKMVYASSDEEYDDSNEKLSRLRKSDEVFFLHRLASDTRYKMNGLFHNRSIRRIVQSLNTTLHNRSIRRFLNTTNNRIGS